MAPSFGAVLKQARDAWLHQQCPSAIDIARRALKAGVRAVGLDLYPLPGGKFDGNNSIHGQISLGVIGGGNTWHSADEAGRQKIWEAHKQYTLEFIHLLRTDAQCGQIHRTQRPLEAFIRQHLGLQVGYTSAAKQIHAGNFNWF